MTIYINTRQVGIPGIYGIRNFDSTEYYNTVSDSTETEYIYK